MPRPLVALAFLLAPPLSAQLPASQRIPIGSHPVPSDRGERHLTNGRQPTFGRENAEAYFSANGNYLTSRGDGGGNEPVRRGLEGMTRAASRRV